MRKVYGKGFVGAAVAAAMLALLLAACGTRPDGPAPVVSGEPAAPVEPELVKVRPGQTLSGIAHAYHVPMQIIAEANHLAPPYHIEVGRTLIIPQTGQPAVPLTSASVSRSPPPKSEEVAVSTRPTDVPLDRTPLPAASSAPTVAAEPPRADVKPAAASPASTATSEPPVASPGDADSGIGRRDFSLAGSRPRPGCLRIGDEMGHATTVST